VTGDYITSHQTKPSPWVPAFGRADDFGLVGLAILLLRHRRWILGIALTAAFLEAINVYAKHRTYTTTSSFMAESRRTPSNLSGIAAQLGIATPAADGPQSPAFYSDLVHSRRILGELANSSFERIIGGHRVTTPLPDMLDVPKLDPRLRQDATLRRLQQLVTSEVVQRTGVVVVSVTAEDPELARVINQRILDLLNEFNLLNRQSQAGAERKFTEQRLNEVRGELRAAEDRLQDFLQRNVNDFARSPSLNFEHQRLTRDVALQGQLYTALAQSFEQAKIEEVRDTPVISIVEQPTAPATGNPRGLVGKSLLAFVVGLTLTVLFLLVRDLFMSSSRDREDVSLELASLKRDALADLKTPIKVFSR
jgi:uncharacterized protein involved in exopolysaccharide biosynthesis